MQRLLITLALLSACTPSDAPRIKPAAVPPLQPAVVVNVPDIAGRSEAEVAQILGGPKERSTATYDGKTYPVLYYQEAQTEVIYVDGEAEWISVRNLNHLPFSPEALPALGFTNAGEPSFANPGVIRWENRKYPPLHGIYLFPAQGGRLDHAYIQVSRAP
ncbi:MAG: hypothetical protein M3418_03010 [Gemmatimonadota bacterium]|jgi:hypothetical protein|nr:hypothetical protein [Gemmatimonadota bacterium]